MYIQQYTTPRKLRKVLEFLIGPPTMSGKIKVKKIELRFKAQANIKQKI